MTVRQSLVIQLQRESITVVRILLGEGWWKLRRLNNNRMVGVGGEPQGTVGGEGGTAHSLEGDDIDAVR